ncbi:pyridoxal-dependent decarboxylase, partial [Aduncisulcus paluster]
MEYEIARKLDVAPSRIIFNGPYKKKEAVQELLLSGGIVNLDSVAEVPFVIELAKNNPTVTLNVGIRCNFKINDGVTSRFGLDVTSPEFSETIDLLNSQENIEIKGMHCHFASRSLNTWKPRAKGMIDVINSVCEESPSHIDLGGGLFGKMKDSLKAQFDSEIPTYVDYANEAATVIAENFKNVSQKPILFIEPGSALVGDVMKFVAKVVSIKNVRGKSIATLLGSIFNINPTLNTKNPPITVLQDNNVETRNYTDLDFAGFTCIESDY